ncbi:MAG: hypothetical protein NXY57DRAFT_960934 [Lentinula lateritia]|uniref:DUF6533 domain-containing protein n=1 Tax=Lentinula lateritia TaxID=40482 RepID=A0ABQ8VI92_9AGAR|nr:MAG: hypothetical protein NXY57DRAFT_960934 [Lentinula lateritia]KAJ4495355.1 hypothetical protein C8R41DRAFT_918801 [Lentinula lateritia]
MTDSIGDLESLYRLKYLSGVALSVMVYDHLLTLNEEFSNIWAAPNRDYFQKLMFVINRYYTEAMVMYVVYVCSGLANLDDAYSPNRADYYTETAVFITLRVYHSWDKRKQVAIILLVAFIIFMAAAAALAVLSAVNVQPAIHFVSFLKACEVPDIPITFPFMMGTLLGFDLFIILVAFFNAFERPHKTHADVLDTLHRDGARSFVVSVVKPLTRNIYAQVLVNTAKSRLSFYFDSDA